MVAQWLTNPTRNHGVGGSVPALAQWVKDLRCHELWCSSQMRLRSDIAVTLRQSINSGSQCSGKPF